MRVQTTDSGGANGTLTIAPPFTIEFDITRNTLTSANVCQIRLYNLSLINRNLIRFNITDYGTFRSIELKAGYGKSNLPTIFTGNISQAWSVREGVNFITQIECYDGGFAFNNAKVNTQVPANTDQRNAFVNIAKTMPGLTVGAVSPTIGGTLARGNSFSGPTIDALRDIAGDSVFVDQSKINALQKDEYISNLSYITINPKSGLLGTPILEQTIVRFDMVFEPGLNVAQKVKLESNTEGNFNGDYKVTAVKHRGMISDSVCGSVITTGEFFYTKILTAVQPQ